MPSATANGIEIEYEVAGPDDGPPVLLIMGLAGQLTWWPADFVDRLVKAGYRVIRFDNRDIGHSHKFKSRRAPNPAVQLMARRFKLSGLAPYTLVDMAQDTVSLLDALGVPKAHIVGVSMGGMISQIMGANFPDRVAGLSIIMSSTNNPRLPKISPEIAKALMSPPKPGASKEEALERSMYIWGLIGTRDSGSTEDELRARLATSYERSNYPAGMRRQLAAIIETGDLRKRFTRKIKAPSLVIHGAEDPLAPLPGGIDISKNIPGAQLEVIQGMGHDLPMKFIPKIIGFLTKHFEAVDQASAKSDAA
ncbi:MAG: alpha/beta hydrolase [Marinicaulis sp.]|nr:alpha/beta fold hydrolase [Marinicaulis sp.]NNE39671.1 alpha/beta hydrolase [Marinicaulis sp.]NNL90419.1 alpha/beta hydrolase [Marinicaulis sp.]